jgi:hypothetical protein
VQSVTDLSHDLMDDDEADEIWQVQLGPGDIRSLSLEQLDDAYRLSIVDDGTLVWKPGMARWASLGSVAGIEPEPETPTRAVGAPPVTASNQSGVVARQLPPQPVGSYPPSLVNASSAPSPASAAPPPSPAPAAFTVPPAIPGAPRMGALGILLLGFFAVGLMGLSAFRNGLLPLEASAVGSPGFGTPSAVEELIARHADAHRVVEVPEELLRKPAAPTTGSADASGAFEPGASAPGKASAPTRGKAAPRPGRASTSGAIPDPLKGSGSKGPARKNDDYDPLNSKL